MAIENSALIKALLNNDGAAHALSGIAAGGASGGAGTGVFIHMYAGTTPVSADDALAIGTTHTYLGTISANAGGTTGGTFLAVVSTPATGVVSTGVLAKNSGETWSTAALAASGTWSFARMGALSAHASVEGSNSATPILQLSVAQAGQPPSDINLSSSALTSGSTFTLDNFQLDI